MKDNRKLMLNIFVFIFYFIYKILPSLFLMAFNIRIYNVLYKSIYLILVGIIYIIFITYLYKNELIEDLKSFKIKSIFKYIPIYALGLFLMVVSSFILYKITGNSLSQNEINVRENIKTFPIFMLFNAVIYAPIIEEITFRKTFRNIITNDFWFIVISGFMFGLIHISGSGDTLEEFLMIIPYILMGINLSYIYYKSNNIFTTITIHGVHNLVLLLIQIIGG